ncbi:MAG: hypothetical protein H6710_19795 [Myxococcales bacterium]|nr:hypothetical protein [Myxococcales bacterium]
MGLARAIGSGLVAVSAGIGLATLEDGKLAIALALTATCAHGLLLALRPQERLAIRLHVGVATLSAVIAVLARSPVAPSLVALTAVAAFALPRRRATWALTLSVTGLYLLVAGPRLDALWPLSLVIGGYLLADLGQRASAIFDAELARRREAEAASIAKEDFLSNVSHEIRTPMSGILGMADAMLRRPLAANVREPIEVMRRSAEAVLTIVEEILDFSKISAVGITLHTNRFDLRQLISEVIALHRPVAEAKGLRLRTQIAVGLPRLLHGDPGRLRQVITNLISNAIKFTQQGWVELTVEGRIDGEVCQTRVRVADSGHGIPLDLLDRIFDPFVQGTEDTERRGTGLGLAIARRIILALGGTITAESAVGEGSTFVIDVPLKVVRKELSAPTSTATTVKAPQAAGAPAAAPRPPPRPPQRRRRRAPRRPPPRPPQRRRVSAGRGCSSSTTIRSTRSWRPPSSRSSVTR